MDLKIDIKILKNQLRFTLIGSQVVRIRIYTNHISKSVITKLVCDPEMKEATRFVTVTDAEDNRFFVEKIKKTLTKKSFAEIAFYIESFATTQFIINGATVKRRYFS